MPKDYEMPIPNVGDTVLYSADVHNFSNPTVAWVLAAPGQSTVTLLVFTRSGFVEKPSVHHKDDPDIGGDNAWEQLGVWDFSPVTKAIYRAASLLSTKERASGQKQQQS